MTGERIPDKPMEMIQSEEQKGERIRQMNLCDIGNYISILTMEVSEGNRRGKTERKGEEMMNENLANLMKTQELQGGWAQEMHM